MKFLLDQDVYAATARFIGELGHDVVTAAKIGCSQASDSQLLSIAKEQGRIFVTRDRDFGGLVFVKIRSGSHLSSHLALNPTCRTQGTRNNSDVLL